MGQRLSEVIALLDDGLTDETCGERLAEIIRACERTGSDGSLTVTIKIKPNGSGRFSVSDDIREKCPRGRGTDEFYFGPKGLTRRHPGQMSLDMIEGGGNTDGS